MALVDCGDYVNIVNGATIHQNHVMVVRGWENTWDRAGSHRSDVIVVEKGILRCELFVITSADVA